MKISHKIMRFCLIALSIGVLILVLLNIFLPIEHPEMVRNVSINHSAITLKQVYPYVNKALKKYRPVRNMKLGGFDMDVGKDNLGDITLSYFEHNKTSPAIYDIIVDTKIHKIKDIHIDPSSDRYKSQNLKIEKWDIDSNDAIQIVKKFFKTNSKFEYDRVSLLGYIDVEKSKERTYVNVMFSGKHAKESYEAWIDPFTRKVVDSRIWEK